MWTKRERDTFPEKKGEKMVCAKCEVKLKRVITPDPWAQRVAAAAKGGKVGTFSASSSSAPRLLLNENKALTSSTKNYILGSQSCSICKKSLHQPGLFCQPCAFQQGKCAMCGVEVQDVSMHNVGGDLERKLRDKSMREKSEKLAKLEKLEEERDNLEEEKRRKKRKKEEKKEEEKEVKEEKDDEEEGEKKKKKTIATASPAVVAKIEPTGATNLVGSLLQQSAGASLATASNAPTWQYDSKSGYYFDASKMQYYDPKTKLYFCCKTNKWLKPENEKPKNGTFKSGTRKPDKFGL